MAAWHSVSALLLVALIQSGRGVPGQLIEHVACASDRDETYTLYLPSRYDTGRKWPLLLVFDPRGRGTTAAAVFREAAETFGWIIVSSDNTRSDGPWEPNRRALAALWPEVLQTYAVDPSRVYAAGFSGGATVAWVLARASGGIAGIIAAGAPAPEDVSATPGRLPWFGSAGRRDFNFLPARLLDDRMARAGNPHRLEFFEGSHQWFSSQLAQLALGWLEMLAMHDGLRPRDDRLAARIVAAELSRAAELEAGGRIVDARRALASIVEHYGALADVTGAAARAGAVDADPRLGRARKEEREADERERTRRATVARALARLRADEPPHVRELLDLMTIPALQRNAGRTGYDGESAQRVLESAFVLTAFYLPQEFEERGDFARAALALEVATSIYPDRPVPWVNLAAARTRAGAKKAAVAALEKAVEAGFRDATALAADARFNALRDTPAYARLLERLATR